MRRRPTTPTAPYQPDRFFVGSTETDHAVIDCYEVNIGRIILRWKAKGDDVVHEVAFWRPAHATPAQMRDIIEEKLHTIDEMATGCRGGGQ